MNGKGLLTFAFGAFVGAVTAYGYFSSKYATDPKDKKEPEIPVASKPDIPPEVEEVKKEDLPANVVVSKDSLSMADLKGYSENVVDYTSFSTGAPEVKKKEKEKDPGEIRNEQRGNPPKIITYEEFGVDEGGERETETLYYFIDNGILTNESQEVVDNPGALVGDTLDIFNQEDYSIIYVRNYLLGVDYAIQRMAGTIM